MSAGRAPVVLVGNSAACWYMGYSQLPLGGKPLGAQKALPSAGPETARSAVVHAENEPVHNVAVGQCYLYISHTVFVRDKSNKKAGGILLTVPF